MATRGRRAATTTLPDPGLPLRLPFPPMEAKLSESVPAGDRWQFEPKWDGFRAIVARNGEVVVVQSKSGQPLGRYFPEIEAAALALPQKEFAIDGEIVIQIGGRLAFDALQLRLHPAASRIEKLSRETPAELFAFDLLVEPVRGRAPRDLTGMPLSERRAKLEKFFERVPEGSPIRISPMTLDRDVAVDWFDNHAAHGIEGVMAKLRDVPYRSGTRDGMVKVKRFRTADCVVGGFRYVTGTKTVATLAVGLYDAGGILHHVGNAGGFTDAARAEVKKVVEPLAGGEGFSGKSPGVSRWSRSESEYVAVEPRLVCELRYDYFTGERFRHATKFLRWRPDKRPHDCTFEQMRSEG
jgi:ATP-dependent DNA ligase